MASVKTQENYVAMHAPQTQNSTQPENSTAAKFSFAAKKDNSTVRYCECMRNHAVSLGGYARDGCGEFISAGGEGTHKALTCAACNCHRNFHRKEIKEEDVACQQQAVTIAEFGDHGRNDKDYMMSPKTSGGVRKRFRTKFTSQQKEKMFSFAESVGWKNPKGNEFGVEELCAEVGISRQALKAWLHNNKKTLGNKP